MGIASLTLGFMAVAVSSVLLRSADCFDERLAPVQVRVTRR